MGLKSKRLFKIDGKYGQTVLVLIDTPHDFYFIPTIKLSYIDIVNMYHFDIRFCTIQLSLSHISKYDTK